MAKKIIGNADFVHLHQHTCYSNFDGLVQVADAAKYAAELGFKALAITDHGNIGGAIKFIQECGKNGIKPIVGEEFYLSKKRDVHFREKKDGNKTIAGQTDGRKGNRHLVLLAKNWVGWQNLCTLSHLSWTEGLYVDPRIDFEILAKHSEGLMCGSACLSSVVNSNLLHDRYDQAKKAATALKDIFKDDFYLEVMYHGIHAEGQIIPDIIKLSKELNIPVVATNDCFVAGTSVFTDKGPTSIEDIKVGDLVLTHKDRFRKVLFVNQRDSDKTYGIETDIDSSAFECTGNHPIFCAEKINDKLTDPIWKNASELSNNDYIFIHKSTGLNPSISSNLNEYEGRFAIKVKSVQEISRKQKVYNLQVEEDETYTANSYIVHNCHYLRKEQGSSHELLVAMSTSKCLHDPKKLSFPYHEFYMKSAEEMGKIFSGNPEFLLNTVTIADKVDHKDILSNLTSGMRLPRYKVPDGYKSPYDYLVYLAWEGMKRCGWETSQPHISQLKLEIEDVKAAWDNSRYDFATYFLIVRDYVQAARDRKILVGSGRGSGYCSILLRAIGITYGVDPLEYGLIWERFLGFEEKVFVNEYDFGFDELKTVVAETSDDVTQDRDVVDDPGGIDRY